MARLTWHGHACFTLETGAHRLVIDPFFGDNPQFDGDVDDVDGAVDFILCTHGHFDHFLDAIPLAKRTGAQLISTFEIASYAESRGVENTHGMHIGGAHRFPFGRAKMTPALHGGQVAGDDAGGYTTVPGGFLLDLDGTRVYHAGDTALLMEMQLLRGQVDLALLPIGDNYTMGPEDAVKAVEFIEPSAVIPIHYGTWELIDQDPHAFARAVGDRARVVVLEPGGSHEF